MLEKTSFTYDGVSSGDMGVMAINSGSGLYKDLFLANRSIIEKRITGRRVSYFKDIDEQPISFPLTIFIQDWQDNDNLREVVRWFNQRIPKPFWFNGSPNRIMYGLIEGSSDLMHNGIHEGYATFTFKTMSPVMYSQPITKSYRVLSNLTISINNDGDETCYPFLTIKNGSGTDIGIKCYADGELISNFELKNLLEGETIEIDCLNENIRSEYEEETQRYLFDNHNEEWISFTLGRRYDGDTSTKIEMTGDFEVRFDYQMVYRVD